MPKHKPPGGTGRIRPTSSPPPPPRVTLTVSLRYLELSGPFDTGACGAGYLPALLERLRDVCRMTAGEFRGAGRALRSHRIDWPGTSRPDGFGSVEQLLPDAVPWQFSLSANEHGRVHGLLDGDLFYLVWLDPTHQLYPAAG